MADPLLPRTIPTRLARILAGRSLRTFKRDLADCQVPGGVSLAALETRLGVEFGPAAFLTAERRLDHTRARERAAKRS